MKNIFKFFSVMLVAGAMLCSCTDPNADDPNNPVTPKYTITATANNDAYGTVTGSGEYEANTVATLTATPNAGYKFVNWNDGNTQNPRTITVTGDANYMANFDKADGVTVTFGSSTTWDATSAYATNYSNMGLLFFGAFKEYENANAPFVQGYFGTNPGNYTHAAGDYYYFFYYENENDFTIDNDGSLSGEPGATLPNWQPKAGFTESVSAIDLNAQTITAVANGECFYLPDYLHDVDNIQPLNIEVRNATWEDAGKYVRPMNTIKIK